MSSGQPHSLSLIVRSRLKKDPGTDEVHGASARKTERNNRSRKPKVYSGNHLDPPNSEKPANRKAFHLEPILSCERLSEYKIRKCICDIDYWIGAEFAIHLG